MQIIHDARKAFKLDPLPQGVIPLYDFHPDLSGFVLSHTVKFDSISSCHSHRRVDTRIVPWSSSVVTDVDAARLLLHTSRCEASHHNAELYFKGIGAPVVGIVKCDDASGISWDIVVGEWAGFFPHSPNGQQGLATIGSAQIVRVPTISPTTVAISSLDVGVVNDYVCPKCKNDRCSRSEKVCWLCGGSL